MGWNGKIVWIHEEIRVMFAWTLGFNMFEVYFDIYYKKGNKNKPGMLPFVHCLQLGHSPWDLPLQGFWVPEANIWKNMRCFFNFHQQFWMFNDF